MVQIRPRNGDIDVLPAGASVGDVHVQGQLEWGLLDGVFGEGLLVGAHGGSFSKPKGSSVGPDRVAVHPAEIVSPTDGKSPAIESDKPDSM